MIGLLYAIFFLKEIKVPKTSEPIEENPTTESTTNGVDNMGFTDAPANGNNDRYGKEEPGATVTDPETPKKKSNFCVEFFDPTLALDCIKVIKKKRENRKHFIIWALILSYMIIIGTAQGKSFVTLFVFFQAPLYLI